MPVAVERLNTAAMNKAIANAGNPASQPLAAQGFSNGRSIMSGDGGGAGGTRSDIFSGQGGGSGKPNAFSGDGGGAGKQNMCDGSVRNHTVQQGQANGFSKQGAQELMNGNVPSSAADRARLRSNVPHPGAAGAPLGAGVASLATAKPGA